MAADRLRQIIFYGDSNTYGYDPADPYRQMFPYDARWTTIVSKNLKDHFQVLAEGMNGRTLPVPPYEQSCVRLEEAMDCLLNAISIMKDEVENEKARW